LWCWFLLLLFLFLIVSLRSKPPTPPSASAETEKIEFSSGIRQLATSGQFWIIVACFAVPNGATKKFKVFTHKSAFTHTDKIPPVSFTQTG
jgi:hypothetical protein